MQQFGLEEAYQFVESGKGNRSSVLKRIYAVQISKPFYRHNMQADDRAKHQSKH